MPKPKQSLEKKICDTALRLSASQEWQELTFKKIAATLRIPVSEVKKVFLTINDILPAIAHQFDAEVVVSIGEQNLADSSPHDRLFEVLMARFDELQKHRKAILNIMDATRKNPGLIRYLLSGQIHSMQKMLKLAGLEEVGIRHSFTTMGLLAVHFMVLKCWQTDTSSDMTKTMAMLDRRLRYAGKAAEILFRLI